MATLKVPELTDAREMRALANRLHSGTPSERIVIRSLLASSVDLVDLARKVVEISKSPGEIARKFQTSIRRGMIEDNWRLHLQRDMEERLKNADLRGRIIGTDGMFCDTSRNIARDIWNEDSVLYKNAAVRRTQPEEQAAKYDAINAGTSFATFWQTVEVSLEAFNTILLWPEVVMRNGRRSLRHRWVAGDQVTAIFDEHDAVEPSSILITDTWQDLNGDRREHNYFFTQQANIVLDEEGRRVDPLSGIELGDAAPVAANEIGEWPFVIIRRQPHFHDFWSQTCGEDLVQLTLKLGRHQTLTNYLWQVSGHKQLVVTGTSIKKSPPQMLDPAASLKIVGEDINSQLVDWQVDFSMRQEVMNGEEIRSAASRGINAERLRKTSYQSAEGAKLAERGLQERREKKEDIFKDAEVSYYRKVCLVARAGYMSEVPDPSAAFEVIHAPIDYSGDPLARIELARQQIAMGSGSLVDLVLEDHPAWSKEEALEHIEYNVNLSAEIAEIRASRNIPADPLNQSRTAEQNGALGPLAKAQNKDPNQPGSLPDTNNETE